MAKEKTTIASGLSINTNMKASMGKSEFDKSYELPWLSGEPVDQDWQQELRDGKKDKAPPCNALIGRK